MLTVKVKALDLGKLRKLASDFKDVWRDQAPRFRSPFAYEKPARFDANYQKHLKIVVRKRNMNLESSRPFLTIPTQHSEQEIAEAVADHLLKAFDRE